MRDPQILSGARGAKSWSSRLVLLLFMVSWFPPQASAQVSDWKQIHFPPLHAFTPKQPRRVELPNGMVIFLQEDHELPLIRGTARIRGGSREEPAGKVGLVQIYGEVWRTGGTRTATGDELDDYLETRAAKVETSGGIDSTLVNWDCLKDNFDDVFKVFVELLRQPEFRADKIPLAQEQLKTAISRRNDEPAGIAAREAAMLGYGADSPYARQPEYATVAAVTREDLVNWHNTYVHPNNIILGVVGDFDSQAMEEKLRAAFGSWPKGPEPKPLELTFDGPKPGVYFVQKDDVDQSNIRMVALGTRRDNPDFYAIEVLNQIFGGSFSSRLVQDIRTAKGLAYGVSGGIGTAFDHPGLFQIAMGTKSSTTAAGIQALDDEIDGLTSKPPTAEELKKAKDTILNSFVFEFDSKSKVLAERMSYEFYGYPADFLERYRDGVEKVTLDDVNRVADKYAHKEKMAVLVVGKASDFDKPLSTFGPVTSLDITVPSPVAGSAKPAGDSNPEGKALLAKVIEAMGGAGKLDSVHALRTTAVVHAKTPQGEFNIETDDLVVFPDRFCRKMQTPMGAMTMVATPSAAFMAAPQGTRDLPGSQKEEMMNEIKRDEIFIAQHAGDPKYTFRAAGSSKVGDADAQVLEVNADGAAVRWFVDPESGRILRASQHVTGMGGAPTEQVVDFDGWKEFGGIQFATKVKLTNDGQDGGSVQVKEVEVNPAVDANLFEKPQ
ncbi:MAG TPA: pitrilysin family protein [Terriglobia bacterium]|nr:pitrilysin family protein [Terriglobia bacterium]